MLPSIRCKPRRTKVKHDWSYQCLVCMQVIWKSLKIREGLHWQNTENDAWEAESDEQRTQCAIEVDTQSEWHSCQTASGFPPAVRRGSGRWGRWVKWWAFLYPANLGSRPYRYEIQCYVKRDINRPLLLSEFSRPHRREQSRHRLPKNYWHSRWARDSRSLTFLIDRIPSKLAPPNLTVRHTSPLDSVHMLNLVFFGEQGFREYVTKWRTWDCYVDPDECQCHNLHNVTDPLAVSRCCAQFDETYKAVSVPGKFHSRAVKLAAIQGWESQSPDNASK